MSDCKHFWSGNTGTQECLYCYATRPAPSALVPAKCSVSQRAFDDEEEYDPFDDPDWCPECNGEGRVVTADYESYFGANYKPCPKCGGDPCYGEPPIS